MTNKLDKILAGHRVYKSPESASGQDLQSLASGPIAIYGIGECAHWFHEIGMKRMGLRPVIALDQNPKKAKWWGIKTSTAEEFLRSSSSLSGNVSVIVCVGSRKTFNIINRSLRKLGFLNIFFLHDFYEFHSFFVWTPNEVACRINKNEESYKAAYSKLSDSLSKEIFCRLIQVHKFRQPLDIPTSPRDEQYFPSDIQLSKGHTTYVCCGAYDGENMRLLEHKLGRTTSILCFEPEPLIYSKLTSFVKHSRGRFADQIICFQNAVYDQNGIFPFIAGDGLGSRLDLKGKNFAQCVKLDDALSTFSPTFISMDIEGSEVAALNGAVDTIYEHLPDLGICVYHYPEQIADVINTISSINSNYKFYVRNYTGYLTETVVYACIEEELC